MNRLPSSQQPHQGGQQAQQTYNSPVPIPSNGASRERNGSLVAGQQQFDTGKSPPNNMANKSTYHMNYYTGVPTLIAA